MPSELLTVIDPMLEIQRRLQDFLNDLPDRF